MDPIVTITPISVGAEANDGTGATLRGGAQQLNANDAALAAAVNVLAAAQAVGVIGYATKAAMTADLAPADRSAALVGEAGANGGWYIKSGATGTGSWSKSAYDPKSDVIALGSLARNRGANFPLKQMTRNGTTSAAPTTFNNAILKVRVINARAGKYYRISYFKNGASLSGPQDGWIITEYPSSTYATAAVETNAIYYTTPGQPDIPRGGIEVVRLVSVTIPGLVFEITLDTTQLPAFGSSIDANSSSARPGWSWIIDPSCYEYVAPRIGGSFSLTGVHVVGDTLARTFAVTVPMGRTYMARWTLQPNGHNSLFNIRKLEIALVGDPTYATWTTMSDTDTDWFPPITVRADANGDGSTTHYYTGGNHGSDGSGGGAVTASTDVFEVTVDGRALGLTESVSGYVQSLTFRWVNSLMGYNTVSLGRKILNQHFTLQITPCGLELMSMVAALESVTIETDNGPQTVGDGFADTCHYYGGTAQARQIAANVTSSGQKSLTTPSNCFATSLGSANGFLTSWVDRSYGAGDGSYVASNWALMRKNSASWKFYQQIVGGVEVPLSAGISYAWRGGYSVAPATIISSGAVGLDSAFIYAKGGKPNLCWAHVSSGAGRIALSAQYSGQTVGAAVVDPQGLRVVASGYLVGNAPIT